MEASVLASGWWGSTTTLLKVWNSPSSPGNAWHFKRRVGISTSSSGMRSTWKYSWSSWSMKCEQSTELEGLQNLFSGPSSKTKELLRIKEWNSTVNSQTEQGHIFIKRKHWPLWWRKHGLATVRCGSAARSATQPSWRSRPSQNWFIDNYLSL